MKGVLFFAMLSLYFNANSQVVSGCILNSLTLEPVPFATIAALDANIATSADSSGKFKFTVFIEANDTLLISSVGFEETKLPVSLALTAPEIKLLPFRIQLDSLVLRSYRSVNTVNSFSSCGLHTFGSVGYSSQVARLFVAPKEFCRLKRIELCKVGSDDRFRIRVYDFNTANGFPGDDLLDTVLEVKSFKRNVQIDLSDYNIILPHKNFFIAIEWLFIQENIDRVGRSKNSKLNQNPLVYYRPKLFGKNLKSDAISPLVHKTFQGQWLTLSRVGFDLLISADLDIP